MNTYMPIDMINEEVRKETGYFTLKDLLSELRSLQEDYLLDARDEDEYTIPLIQQIRDRLNRLEELES